MWFNISYDDDVQEFYNFELPDNYREGDLEILFTLKLLEPFTAQEWFLDFTLSNTYGLGLRTEAYGEELLSSKFMFEGVLIPVSSANHVAMVVYAQSVFFIFGDVFPVQFVYHREFPTICTGTRTLLMSVKDSVPSTVNVYGFECRV